MKYLAMLLMTPLILIMSFCIFMTFNQIHQANPLLFWTLIAAIPFVIGILLYIGADKKE